MLRSVLFWLLMCLLLLAVGFGYWRRGQGAATPPTDSTGTGSPRVPATSRAVVLDGVDGEANTQAILAAAEPGYTVLLPAGRYPIRRLWLAVSGVRLVGTGPEPTTLYGADHVLIELGDVSGLVLENIAMLGTGQSNETHYLGLLTARNRIILGLSLIKCQFSAPGLNTNGFKLVADTPTSRIENLTVQTCLFNYLGRMGGEVQSHQAGATTLYNLQFLGNEFKYLGLVATNPDDHHGMAISVSGAANGVVIDGATVVDPYNIGVEVVGAVRGLRISNVNYESMNRTNTEAGRPLSILSVQPGMFSPDFEFTDARIEWLMSSPLDRSGSVFLSGLRGCTLDNCFFVTPDGWVALVNCNDNTFRDLGIRGSSLYGLLIEYAPGRSSEGNRFVNLRNDVSRSQTLYDAVRQQGERAQLNYFL